MKPRILAILCVLWAMPAWADVHTVGPSDCSAATVNTALAAASAGDIVELTCTGTVEWNAAIAISGGKTLRGPGVKGASGTSGSWPLIINVTYGGSPGLVVITNAASQPLNRLTGFKFQGTGNPVSIVRVYGAGTGTDGNGSFRIDNNYFDGVSYSSRTIFTDGTTGQMTGAFDHNVMVYASPAYSNNSYQNSYKGASATCIGYDSGQRDVGFGGLDFVFWESNYLENVGIETSDGGGRLVFRYNEVVNNYATVSLGMVDGHGADTGGHLCNGVRAVEVYNNTLSAIGAGGFAQVVFARGGTWRVFNNVLAPDDGGTLRMTEYRANGEPNCLLLDWNECSGGPCCVGAYSQCPTAADFASAYPLPNQITDTVWWNNTRSGAAVTPTVDDVGATTTYIVANRDYWVASSGLAANRPGTCTTGTFYGATDTGALWKCTSTVTWTSYYTPLAYPHPLAAVPAAPTGVRIK